LEPGGPGAPAHPYPNFQERFRTAYEAELTEFVAFARDGRPSPCTVEDAEVSLRVAAACDLSRAEHRPVRVAEVA
jgi:myo-inositol 2-dehydrogenase/D-chiro-inositol 1-dehydrogenase